MKKILCFKLRHSDKELLNECITKYGGYELVEESKSESFLSLSLKDINSCFLYIDESMDIKTFEVIVKKMSTVPINVILKYKNFDFLMVCYKYQLCSVYEVMLTKNEVENTLVKIDLLSDALDKNLPTAEVFKLFSSPMKIKTNFELYNRLMGYFREFDSVEAFSVIEFGKDGVECMGGIDNPEIERTINMLEIPKKYIGYEDVININNQEYIVAPLYSSEGRKVWLCLLMNIESKNYVLNHLFYKFLENVLIYRVNKEKEQNLTRLATTDDVTGLYNQRKLSEDLEKAVKLHEKENENFSIMFIDVDHFKSVNDSYGHVIGSKLLQDIGEVLSLILRDSDHIYRYGGDEFVVIMPTVDIGTVHEIANRVLYKIKNKKFDIGNDEIYKLSVSIGIAEYPTDAKSAIEIIQFADEMMYMSKRSGRGKVFHVNEVENVDASSK